MNVGEFLDIASFRYPDKTGVVFGGRRYTFSQIMDRVQRVMTGMARLGVKKGERVSALMWNSPEMMEVYLAAMRLGAVFAPFNYRFKDQELAYVAENAKPSVLVTDGRCQELAAKVMPAFLGKERLFSTAAHAVSGFSPYEAMISENPPGVFSSSNLTFASS